MPKLVLENTIWKKEKSLMVQQKQFNLLNTSKNLKMEFIRTPKEIWQSLSF